MDVRVRRVRRLIALIWRVGPMRTIRLAFRRIASACAPGWPAHPRSRNALNSSRRFWRRGAGGGGDGSVFLLDHLM